VEVSAKPAGKAAPAAPKPEPVPMPTEVVVTKPIESNKAAASRSDAAAMKKSEPVPVPTEVTTKPIEPVKVAEVAKPAEKPAMIVAKVEPVPVPTEVMTKPLEPAPEKKFGAPAASETSKKEPAPKPAAAPVKTEAASKPVEVAMVRQAAPKVATPKAEAPAEAAPKPEEPPAKIVTRDGWLRSASGLFKKPGTHQLMSGNTSSALLLCFIACESTNLAPLDGKHVKLTGGEYWQKGWNQPLIKVQHIEPLP
jgi:hypothetical protein